jgi:hypothetical protein
MICEFRNWLVDSSMYIITGDGSEYSETETDLLAVIFWIMYFILVILLIGWWLVPIRLIFGSIKFKCSKK